MRAGNRRIARPEHDSGPYPPGSRPQAPLRPQLSSRPSLEDAVSNPVHRMALSCAERGWPVFPCLWDSKVPLTRHGYLDASTDLDQVTRWFARHPHRNLAVATGAPGPDVLDIDYRGPAAHGFPALRRLRAAGLLDNAAAQVRTPSGGRHVYFTGSTQRTSHLAAAHVDFLAAGGYVLLPPARVGGKPYQFAEASGGHGGLDWDAAAKVLEPSRSHQRPAPQPSASPPGERVDALARWVAAQPEGNRNAGLFWAANRALEADQAADLSSLAAAARQAGLTDKEITRTLNSARRTAQASPEPPGHDPEGAS